ncbi:MAG: hypothetical protein U1C70_06855 [Sediminibacterium sp.]|jgi:hypothetical protein|uniref:hypothetical protein n=1 Tax=Sediminibacterium sp. TaxID=1917865 RepID=UPI002AB83F05|nr:hypothetical protein [Sediminibacterium sp.]MDZ4071524.1 hypothetical protein [Sediminibacterium sp.]
MNIVWQMYLDDNTCFDNITAEEKILFDCIWDYVKGRLMPLKDEIDKEEAKDMGVKNKGVIIGFPYKGIGCQGYSNELQQKILSCFDQNGIDAMYLACNEKLKALNN